MKKITWFILPLFFVSCLPAAKPVVQPKQPATQEETVEEKEKAPEYESELQKRADEKIKEAQQLKQQCEQNNVASVELAAPYFDKGKTSLKNAESFYKEKKYLEAISEAESAISSFNIALDASKFDQNTYQQDITAAKQSRDKINAYLQENQLKWKKAGDLNIVIEEAETAYNQAKFSEAQKKASEARQMGQELEKKLPDVLENKKRAETILNETKQKIEENREKLSNYLPERLQEMESKLSDAGQSFEQGDYEGCVKKCTEIHNMLQQALDEIPKIEARVKEIEENLNKIQKLRKTASEYKAEEYFPEETQQVDSEIENLKNLIESRSFDEALNKSQELIPVIEELVKKAKEKWFSENVYVVKKGDCLWNIAKKLYKKPLMWKEIYKLNKDKIKDPDLIYPNQEFILPVPKE